MLNERDIQTEASQKPNDSRGDKVANALDVQDDPTAVRSIG